MYQTTLHMSMMCTGSQSVKLSATLSHAFGTIVGFYIGDLTFTVDRNLV